MSFSDIDIPQGNNKDNAKIEELFDVYSISKESAGEWTSIRFLKSPVMPIKMHWIKIRAGKDKREVKIPKVCLAFDPKNPKKERGKCPYCSLSHGPKATAQAPVTYYTLGIVRDIQDSEPKKTVKPSKAERKKGYKDIDSDTWTPVRVIRLPISLVGKLKKLEKLNTVKDKKTGSKVSKAITDKKYGRDVNLMFDKDASGADAYQLQLGDERTPLTDEELAYVGWDLSDPYAILEALGVEDIKQAKEEFKRMDFVGDLDVDDEDDDDDDDDDDLDLSSKKKKKKKSSDKKKSGKKKKKKSSDDDDDDEPKKKKKKKSSDDLKSKKKKKKKSSDDDDEPKKKKKKKKSSDDDDEPKKKKKKKSSDKSSSKKKKKKKKDDDDIPF